MCNEFFLFCDFYLVVGVLAYISIGFLATITYVMAKKVKTLIQMLDIFLLWPIYFIREAFNKGSDK